LEVIGGVTKCMGRKNMHGNQHLG